MGKKIAKKKQDRGEKKKHGRHKIPVWRCAFDHGEGYTQVLLLLPRSLNLRLIAEALAEGDDLLDVTVRRILTEKLVGEKDMKKTTLYLPPRIKHEARELGLSPEEYVNMTLAYLGEQKKKLIKEIQNFVEHGKFKLSGGQTSSYYVNVKEACSNPCILEHIIKEMKTVIKGKKVDRIACVELGAVPIAVALSQSTGVDYSIIRKKTKSHGAGEKIIGKIKKGQHVLLVEDVTTTGKSAVNAVKIIRQNGGIAQHVISVVDRNKGAVKFLKKHGVYLASLLKNYDLLEGKK